MEEEQRMLETAAMYQKLYSEVKSERDRLYRLLAWALPYAGECLREDLSDGGVGMHEDFEMLYEAKELIDRRPKQ